MSGRILPLRRDPPEWDEPGEPATAMVSPSYRGGRGREHDGAGRLGLSSSVAVFRQGQVLATAPRWNRAELLGRLAELSGRGAHAALTMACLLVLDAQWEGEPVAWVSARTDMFFPPDVAELGIDLAALPVVRTSDAATAARMGAHLLRSGAYGLLILDLGGEPQVPVPLQARLVRMAQQHGTAVLCLTEKSAEAPSVGSLVSLRAEAQRTSEADGRFRCGVRVLKDKRRGPGWTFTEVFDGPPGLR